MEDHDIIDGFGSYPNHFNRCHVFTGLGSIAYKYYMLFQQQSVYSEKEEDEPTWLLGTAPGPYIPELSRSIFTFLGREVAFLGLDCRTERMVGHGWTTKGENLADTCCRKTLSCHSGPTRRSWPDYARRSFRGIPNT